MNEVKKVHLGRQQFVISVEAHKALRDYLAAIEKQPGVQAEVVKEIEVRMAELLIEHGVSGDKVVLPEDVDFLKEQLGEPRDFKDESAAEEEGASARTEDATSDGPKKLYRDTEDAWLAGVASGLAAYTGIDVLLVRVAFIITTFAWGFGPIAYIIIWLLAPEAKTPSERLQMRGKAVTVDSLKEMVDRADIAGVSERAGRNFGRVLSRIVEGFVKIVLGIIGVGFMLAALAVIVWSSVVGSYLLLHNGKIGADFQFPVGIRETIFTGLSFGTFIIIGFFLLLAGIAMVWRKWRFPTWATVSLLGIVLVTATVGTALGFDIYPGVRDRYRQAHHVETRQLPSFSGLAVEGSDVTYNYQRDDKYFVELNYLGSSADLKTVVTKVDDKGTLQINTKGYKTESLCSVLCINGNEFVTVTVHAPMLETISLSGNDNIFEADQLLSGKQTKSTIRIEPHNDNVLHLTQLNANSVSLSGSRPSEYQLSLANTQSDFVGGRLTYSGDEDIFNANYPVNDFSIDGSDSCELDEPRFYLGRGSSALQVDDKLLSDTQELRKLQSPDARNVYNCVVVR